MAPSLRRQLLAPLLLVLVTAVVAMAGFAAWLGSSRQAALERRRQDEVAGVLAEAGFPLTAPVLRQMARLSGQEFVLWDPAGRHVVESSLQPVPGDLAQSMAGYLEAEREAKEAGAVRIAGDEFSVRPFRLRQEPQLQMLMLSSKSAQADARFNAIWPPLAIGLTMLVLLVPWLLTLTGRWLSRIEQIQQAVAAIAAGNPEPREPGAPRQDELSELVGAVRRMSERLERLQLESARVERERLVAQLAAGFAHQFRNGVAGASLALQLHSGRCRNPGEQSLAVAQKQLKLLEAEIRGILSLARRNEAQRESIAVAELIDEVVELVSAVIEHHHVNLERDVAGCGARIDGSRDGLRAALVNVLLNAIEATGPKGAIRVSLRESAGWVEIEVRDQGPGPAPEVSERMTEAFVTTKPEGIGLGLTVVSTVAHDHGGRLAWRREPPWTIMTLSLPLNSAEH